MNNKLRIGILSLGCPKTLVDSEVILGKLSTERFTITPTIEGCDVALINTCAFIESAQRESIDYILRLIEMKKEGDVGKVIVMGCLAQRFHEELEKELREVDAFVGSGEYEKLPQIIDSVTAGGRVTDIGLPGYLYTSGEARVSLTPKYSRYVKISEGCDHTCSFCVIPQFRGKHRSRALGDIVTEAEGLIDEGARELILTAQDTTFFGYDTEGRYLLPELLKQLNGLPDLKWIRLLYAYPSLVSGALIDAMANFEKVCHYLDMPLQHISDKILKSMKRGTTKSSMRRLIGRLRERIPDLVIRTTFIVGYPGESERDFGELLDFMRESHFERLGIFIYSPEVGSSAAGLSEQISEQVKRDRLHAGMALQQEISRENNRRLIGRTLDVLVEEYDGDRGCWKGRSYMDAPDVDGEVYLGVGKHGRSAVGLQAGDFIKTRVVKTDEYDLVAEIGESLSV